VASVPQISPIADKLMQAAGYQTPNPVGVDPNFPVVDVPSPVDVAESGNTSPMFPAKPEHAATGLNQGIESEAQ
jgi:hypothetical protein